jgi:hypothetical protein
METTKEETPIDLISAKDVAKPFTGGAPDAEESLEGQIVLWAEEYLARPHPDLGRGGAVCPFVDGSLRRGLFFITYHTGRFSDSREVAQLIRPYKTKFLELEPRRGAEAQYKTILILFPDMNEATEVLDQAQAELKHEFVDLGLMVGQFHSRPPSLPGLWNPHFRPFHSPVPLIAIRFMVADDFPFLQMEARFITAYLRRWSGSVPHRLREPLRVACENYQIYWPEGLGEAASKPSPIEMSIKRDARRGRRSRITALAAESRPVHGGNDE